MTKVECTNGHLYDADRYSTCPYCSEGQNVINFGEVSVGEGGVTLPPKGPEIEVGEGGVTLPPKGPEIEVGEGGVTLPPRGSCSESVVGWLVCIEGKNRGKDYRLYGRINTIGRSEKMDVCIQGDSSITRDVHVRIGYDPKNNRFHIIAANGINNTYVNGDSLYTQIELHAYDVIEMGDTKLLFISMCNRHFSWSNGLNRGGDNAVF